MNLPLNEENKIPTTVVVEETKQEVKAWSVDAWDAIKNDGCTGIPNLWLESPCDRHDRHYATHKHRDGTPISRLEADWELAKDAWKALPVVPPDTEVGFFNALPFLGAMLVRLVAKNTVPIVVFVGVRFGGVVHW